MGADLLPRERRARLRLPGWIADHGGEVADEKNSNVTEILKMLQLPDHHGMAQMNIRGRRIDAQLGPQRSEEHTSELQSPCNLVCRLLLEKKKQRSNCLGLIIERAYTLQ